MGRQQAEPQHLLDTPADNNIGNSVLLYPQPVLAGVTDWGTVIPQTNPQRVLVLTGPSRRGQTTTVTLTASRVVGSDNPNPGVPGPITGVVEFGNGGQFTRVEVDVPIGPFAGNVQASAPATEPQDGGVIVTVPAGVLRVYARYDNLLIQAPLGVPTRSLAQRALPGVPFIGPGGPYVAPHVFFPAEPIRVKAMATYFGHRRSVAWKTNYLYIGKDTGGLSPDPIALSAANIFCIPAFARSFKVLRQPAVAVDVVLYDNALHTMERVAIAADAFPLITLSGSETLVSLQSHTPADTVYVLALAYEIGI
jgi:hypothetical protein